MGGGWIFLWVERAIVVWCIFKLELISIFFSFFFSCCCFFQQGEGDSNLQFVSHWETVVVLAGYKSTALENNEGTVAILD